MADGLEFMPVRPYWEDSENGDGGRRETWPGEAAFRQEVERRVARLERELGSTATNDGPAFMPVRDPYEDD